MRVGTGRITKMVEEFLNYNGEAVLTSNEIDHRFIQKVVYEKGFGLSSLRGKKFLAHPAKTPVTAWGISQTSDT
ncbi:hypothetical protein [Paenibacillus xylaniclasticus]|uniref:hypothetical protein n=1 Tax=Paenibacillus xylaniclasticus TaxID=588083 RepID=UPI000FD989A1|nr:MULTISPECIES: hypothetical protein [Paenibacillus]GFN32453.1 hypothetical protein PCURB6_27130 [Paenibacillus curdlanolyticus]